MCTGSGKTRVIQEITKYQNKRILIVFPWLALLKQFWEDRLNPFRSHICVRYYATEGILRSVKKLNMDELQEESYIILTTYTSAPDIYAKISDENAVDLIIHDEAHRAERDIYSAAFAKIVDNVKHYLNLSATLPNKDGYEADYKYSLLRGIKDGVVRDFNRHMLL
jgi:superfamily II DNA or RNA helicase